jgi:hypothetical protein
LSDHKKESFVFKEFLEINKPSLNLQTILSLNVNHDFFKNLHRLFKKKYELSETFKVPRILDASNMLIPDITLMQNYQFFLELNNVDSGACYEYDILSNFKEFLHFKRGQVDEDVWQTFGLIFYILLNKNISFISAPLAVALSGKKKLDLLYVINELKQKRSIFFFANPPAIDIYKNACKDFRILSNDNISKIINYDEARKCIMEHNSN